MQIEKSERSKQDIVASRENAILNKKEKRHYNTNVFIKYTIYDSLEISYADYRSQRGGGGEGGRG